MARYLLLYICFLFSSARAQIVKPDSLLSFQMPFDTPQLSLPKFAKGDSLLKIENSSDTLKALTSRPNDQLNRAEGKLNPLQHSFQVKLDSLTKLPQPDSLASKMRARITAQSDSLNSKMSALEIKIEPASGVGKVTSTIQDFATQTQEKVNEKLSDFQQNRMANLPSVRSLPSLTSVSLPGSEAGNMNLPNASLPEMKTSNIELPPIDLPYASRPGIGQPSIVSINKLESIGNYSEKIAEVTGQLKDYQKEINDFDPDKLDEIKNTHQWEEKLTELDELEEVKKQIALGDQAKRYYDPEVAKEEALNKAKQEAINHFAGHEEELKAAMEQLSKLKAKMPDTEGVVDLFAKHQNPLKDMPFIERIVPGLVLQFQKQGSFWLDLNPTLAYKVSGRFVGGLGWNERLAYDFDIMDWDCKNHIYGPRSFIHFKLKQNFWLKVEVEAMRSPLRATPIRGSDIVGRGWVPGYFAGIKRDFQLSRAIKGNVQMVYNLYNPEKKSPYTNRLNVRMGLELPLKKTSKQVQSPEQN